MRRSLLLLTVLCALLVLGACNSEPAKAPEPAATDAAPAPDASADPLSGTWKGDWGPSANDRNPVTVELKLDGTAVTGTVNPGENAVALTKGSYNQETSMLNLEADAKGHDGKDIHYVIEGKVEGATITGTWNHEDKKGDFKLSKG